jgi:chitin disaccharide deacetylase
MSHNPTLQQLGFASSDRVVVIHADDIGMYEATLGALDDLFEAGTVSSGAIMVPCPWFPAAAAWSRTHPEFDIGVHITLTSEWERYRWRQVSAADSRSSLLDAEGYLPRSVPELEAQASDRDVYGEILAQIQRARQFGLEPSHIDSHMFACKARLFPQYLRAATECAVLPFLLRADVEKYVRKRGDFDSSSLDGIPIFDHLARINYRGAPEDCEAHTKSVFDSLQAGLTCYLLHPSRDTPELRSIVPNWRHRVAEWKTFTSAGLRNYLRSSGIHVVSYAALKSVYSVTRHGKAR